MPDLSGIKAIADAGGWTACILLIAIIGIGATKKFRWWVPGWIYEDERAQRGISEAQSDRTTKALEKMATAHAAMARDYELLRAELADLRALVVKHD